MAKSTVKQKDALKQDKFFRSCGNFGKTKKISIGAVKIQPFSCKC